MADNFLSKGCQTPGLQITSGTSTSHIGPTLVVSGSWITIYIWGLEYFLWGGHSKIFFSNIMKLKDLILPSFTEFRTSSSSSSLFLPVSNVQLWRIITHNFNLNYSNLDINCVLAKEVGKNQKQNKQPKGNCGHFVLVLVHVHGAGWHHRWVWCGSNPVWS